MVIRTTGTSEEPEVQQGNSPVVTPFRLFEDLFNNWAMHSAMAKRHETWRPPVDILEKENKLIIRTEIPGVEEKDINLKLDGRTLKIQGERKLEPDGAGLSYHQVEGNYGTFSRSFDLPGSVDTEKISAAYANGVLTVTISQRPEVQPRTIQISA